MQTTKKIWNDKTLYMMLFPGALYFIVFHAWPIAGMRLAFYEYRIVGDNIFAGLKYFRELFSTPLFFDVLANTLIISTMKLVIIFPLPVLFALMLNEFRNGRFRKSVQVVTYLPHFLSWVVIAGIWFEFLSPSTGVVSEMARLFGWPAHDFLTDKNAIRWVLVASEAWRSIGWDSIIFVAAIQGIGTSLYEAAYVDGAGRWRIVTRIVIPHLYPTMATVFILNVGFLLYGGLDQVLNFTNASVNSKIDIIDTYVYRMGLLNYQYSFATAASLFKSVIGVALILATHAVSRKLTSKGAW